MLKLLNPFADRTSAVKEDLLPEAKFSRFAPRHVREESTRGHDMHPEAHFGKTVPVAAHRPITRAALNPEPKFSDSAHLYADDRISISVLRRALPERFSTQN
jgi:hypothetical protein